MNMQAMLKQAQKLQKDMMKSQEEIRAMSFVGKSSNVTVTINGSGEVTSVKYDLKNFDIEDVELLEDMTMLAFNNAKKELDKETESKMGAFTNGMPGLF